MKSKLCKKLALVVFLILCMGCADGSDDPDGTYSTVELLEKKSDAEESSYQVGAALPKADFSSIGRTLADKIVQEWKVYDGMSEEQRLTSSKLWGLVDIQTNTWKECEETIGLTVDNPLESMDWLNKTSYFGMESTAPNTSEKHIQVLANTARSGDRELNSLDITAGYNVEDIRITFNATLSADAGIHTLGSVCTGYATYEEETVATGSGIPVLIVTTHETNNNGYYNGDYFDPTAYWVKDNVFYTLRVFGDEVDKAEIQAALERILEDV